MICNYTVTDDNHLVNEGNYIDALKVSLEKGAHNAISWFIDNYMDANPKKKTTMHRWYGTGITELQSHIYISRVRISRVRRTRLM